MNKNTAFDIISRYKADISFNSELAEALDVALKALRPEPTKYVYALQLRIGGIKSPLWLEVSDDRCKMQSHIAELREKVVERCKNVTSGFEYDFRYGSAYNFTANKNNKNELPFIFEGKHYCFIILRVLDCNKARYELSIEHDADAVQDVVSNVLKL